MVGAPLQQHVPQGKVTVADSERIRGRILVGFYHRFCLVVTSDSGQNLDSTLTTHYLKTDSLQNLSVKTTSSEVPEAGGYVEVGGGRDRRCAGFNLWRVAPLGICVRLVFTEVTGGPEIGDERR